MELWKLIFIVAFACVGAAVLYVTLTPSTPSVSKLDCGADNNCVLSQCDCKCHPKGQTPEEQENVFCGINCLAKDGVSGCICSNGSCVTQ